MVDLAAANHTNRELELMLQGKKPLAVFYAESSELPNEELIPAGPFYPHIESGAFVHGEAEFAGPFSSTLGRCTQLKYVLYAVRGQEWRIPAFLLMLSVRGRTGNNESLERLESTLLGYTEEDIDAWCNHCFREPAT